MIGRTILAVQTNLCTLEKIYHRISQISLVPERPLLRPAFGSFRFIRSNASDPQRRFILIPFSPSPLITVFFRTVTVFGLYSDCEQVMADPKAIIHAYRQLYRQGLKTINYAIPQRHVLRRTLRESFRSEPRENFDPQRITRTIQFLQYAESSCGFEHRIVKNLLATRYWEQPQIVSRSDQKL